MPHFFSSRSKLICKINPQHQGKGVVQFAEQISCDCGLPFVFIFVVCGIWFCVSAVFVPVQMKNLWLSCQEIHICLEVCNGTQNQFIVNYWLSISKHLEFSHNPPMIFEEKFQKQGCDAHIFTCHKLVSEKIVSGVKLYVLVILLGN
jgi:hypothetical protein